MRVRKQIEKELTDTEDDVRSLSSGPSSVDNVVDRLEQLLDCQLQAFKAAVQQHVDDPANPDPPRSSKRGSDVDALSMDHLEATMRRVLTAIEAVQTILQKLASGQRNVAVAPTGSDNLSPAWVCQATASTTSTLDGRLQSLEKSVRDAVAGGRSAFEAAACIAQEAAATGLLQLQQTHGDIRDLAVHVRHVCLANAGGQEVTQAVRDVKARVERAAAVADHRAGSVSQALMAFADLHALQVELLSGGIEPADLKSLKRANKSPQRPASGRAHA